MEGSVKDSYLRVKTHLLHSFCMSKHQLHIPDAAAHKFEDVHACICHVMPCYVRSLLSKVC